MAEHETRASEAQARASRSTAREAAARAATVHAASLDDPSRYTPQAVTYTVRGQAWVRLDPALPKFERMPPR